MEEPNRAIRQLMNLARGHALSQGRNYVTRTDIPIVINVVLSTASIERVRVFETLLNFGGSLTTRQVCDYIGIQPPTAKKTMTELKAIGLVSIGTIPSEHGEPTYEMILEEKFDWFLSDEFKELKYRKIFSPLIPYDSIQKCIVLDDTRQGGNFSFGMPGLLYSQQVLLNSIIPRTLVK